MPNHIKNEADLKKLADTSIPNIAVSNDVSTNLQTENATSNISATKNTTTSAL